ncbi:hypothetical protein ACVIGB_000425 [Bradyrhizobium sp. USDA 4341]
MAGTLILDFPFCYKVSAVPVGCRRARPKVLRDTIPAEVKLLSTSEAPVRLQAALTFAHNSMATQHITLRHDGSGYLRAVANLPARAGGEPRPFTFDDFERMLRWEADPWAAVHGELDSPSAFLTTRSVELRASSDHGYMPAFASVSPQDLPHLRTIRSIGS